ncbi:MAG: hypothetical protein FWH42_02350 [Dehalococcoidia bacterium]|nr:hypothetical protein [Dehalococcoidia bacterium]
MKNILGKPLNMFTVGIAIILLLSGMLMPLCTGCDDKVLANDNSQEEENSSPDDVIEMPELDAETELMVRLSYLARLAEAGYTGFKIDDIFVDYYYGTYNECVAVMMSAKGMEYLQVVTFSEDGTVSYSNSNRILAWKNSIFYSLQEAYDQGFLTRADLQRIADIHSTR